MKPIFNRAPLTPNTLSPLPLGSIRPEEWLLEQLQTQRDGMTAELARLRNKLKLAQRIIDDQPMLRGKVEAEKEQMREWYFPQRTLEQNKDRHRDDGAR